MWVEKGWSENGTVEEATGCIKGLKRKLDDNKSEGEMETQIDSLRLFITASRSL